MKPRNKIPEKYTVPVFKGIYSKRRLNSNASYNKHTISFLTQSF